MREGLFRGICAKISRMAYIRNDKGKWRAQVQVTGFKRCSASFDTEEQAKLWADEKEALLKRRRRYVNATDSLIMSKVPRIYLQAMAKTDYTHEEIVAAAIPMAFSCGIYFLIKNDEVVYVGQSVDVMSRISKHRRADTDFDFFNVVTCEPESLDEMEQAYIFALTPRYNTVYGGRKAKRTTAADETAEA